MNYRISYTGTEGVRLQQIADMLIIPFIGSVLSGIMLLVGLGMVMNNGMSDMMGWAFLAAVPLFAIVPWFIVGKSQQVAPQEIIFDNTNAVVAFVQKSRRTKARAYLAYQDVATFDYLEVFSSSGTGTTTRTRAYVVRLIRTNGMAWNLASFTSERKAQQMTEALLAYVDVQKQCHSLPLEALPPTVEIEKDSGHSSYTWKQKTPLAMVAFVLLFFTTFFGLIFLMSRSADFGAALWIIGGVAACIAIAVVAGMIRGIGRSQTVRLTSESIEFIESKKGREIQHQSIALTDIIAADIDFSGSDVQSTLRFLTKQYMEEFAKLREGGLSVAGVWNSIKSIVRLPSVQVGYCSVAERLTIEHHLNREIAKRQGKSSLYTEHTQGMYWWEGEVYSSDSRRWLLSNRSIGITTLLFAPLPIFSVGILLLFHKGIHSLSTLYMGYGVIECLRVVMAFYAGFRLWKNAAKKLRGALLLTLSLAAVVFALLQDIYHTLLCLFLLIVAMLIGGITLLSTPDAEEV